MVTDTKPAIHERLAAILDELPAIGKDAFNPGQKFNFRSIDAILNELNPLLGKHGVFLLPQCGQIEMSTRPTRNGEATVAVVTVTYHFTADDGTFVSATTVGEGQDSGDKAVSKAMTMALKTCLGQVFAISTEEDPDGGTADDLKTKTPSAGEPDAQTGPGPGAAQAETPAPPAPPGLAERRTWCYEQAKALPPAELESLKKAMAEMQIPMDFSSHTLEQVIWLENKFTPF